MKTSFFKKLGIVAILFLIAAAVYFFMQPSPETEEQMIMRKYGFKVAKITIKNDKIFLDKGVLGQTFHEAFVKKIKANPQVKTLVLMNLPGSINDEWNVKTCEFVYKNNLNTQVLANSNIDSGAVDLFAAGKKLFFTKGAKLGVHSWSGEDYKPALSYPKDDEVHKIFLELYKKVNIDTAFYWFTLRAAPGEAIHYMNEKEIKQYFGHKLNTQ